MKVIIDTNVIVSGLLWRGPPNQILRWARDGFIYILCCEAIIKEVDRVIHYSKFFKRLNQLDISPRELIAYLRNLTVSVPNPDSIPKVILDDIFDNIFLAIVSENNAHLIISGDKHLLNQKEYNNIQIVTPNEATGLVIELIKKA